METLHKLLVENYKEMSRWEVYKSEVESGHLRWGTVHTEQFFKENARMMEGTDGDFKLLKVNLNLAVFAQIHLKLQQIIIFSFYILFHFRF